VGAGVYFLWRGNQERAVAPRSTSNILPDSIFKEVRKCFFDAVYIVRLIARGQCLADEDPPLPYTREGAVQADALLAWVECCRRKVG